MDYSKIPLKWSIKKQAILNKQTGRPMALHKAMQIVYDLGHREISPQELEDGLIRLAESEPEHSARLNQIKELWGVPDTITDFIEKCYERNGVSISMSGNLVHTSSIDPDVACKAELIDYNDLVRKLPKEEKQLFPTWGVKELTIAMERHNQVVSAQKRSEFAQSIEFRKQTKPYEFRKLIEALTGDPDPESKRSRITSVALRHVLWQIKRKLINAPVEHHMLILISGPQGSGKTTLLRKLCAPFEDLYIEPNVEDLLSKFSSQIVERYYIANIEEWSHDERTNASGLKKLLTAEKRTERQMFSMSTRTVQQNLTLFATSNQDIKRVIYDPTGMRRFFEINLNWLKEARQKHLDFELINSIDFVKVWKYIDETSEAPILEDAAVFREIQETQESYRSKGAAETFLENYQAWPILKGESKQTKFYPLREIYELYITSYSRGIGRCLKAVSYGVFTSQVLELDVESCDLNQIYIRLKRFNADVTDDSDELEHCAIDRRRMKEMLENVLTESNEFDDSLL